MMATKSETLAFRVKPILKAQLEEEAEKLKYRSLSRYVRMILLNREMAVTSGTKKRVKSHV